MPNLVSKESTSEMGFMMRRKKKVEGEKPALLAGQTQEQADARGIALAAQKSMRVLVCAKPSASHALPIVGLSEGKKGFHIVVWSADPELAKSLPKEHEGFSVELRTQLPVASPPQPRGSRKT